MYRVTPAVHSQLTRINTLKPAVLGHVWIPVSWECTAEVVDSSKLRMYSRSHRVNPTFPLLFQRSFSVIYIIILLVHMYARSTCAMNLIICACSSQCLTTTESAVYQ